MNKKKVKFFWIYTLILFTVALVLVLFSLTNVRQKENFENRVQSLQTEYETLARENTELKETNKALEEKYRLLSESVNQNKESMEQYADAVEKIYEADTYYSYGDYQKAKEVIDSVDANILKEKIRTRYVYVKDKIEAKL